MNEVLSQDEIDQLLSAISSGDAENDDFKLVNSPKKIKIYDFKRPSKFSKEQLRTVSNMHETFACLTTTSLSAQLRSLVHVHVASVDEFGGFAVVLQICIKSEARCQSISVRVIVALDNYVIVLSNV